jgi:uncharacterized protein (TIGR00369 family)
LHGGASVALAESVGSAASFLYTEISEVRGIEISANHLKAKRNGIVTYCSNCPSRKSIHLWEIRITDENENLICKLTNMILPKKKRE